MNEVELELRQFFTGLADATRLQIAGRLAAGDLSAEQLAAALGEKLLAVKHHLARLEQAGLVSGPAGPAQTYALRLDHIHALAARVLGRPQAVVPEDAGRDDYDSKVLKDYLTPEGQLREIPLPGKKLKAVLRFVLNQFEFDRQYTEKEVNALLQTYHPDSATLRRALVDNRWLERQSNGAAYQRVPSGPASDRA